MSTTTEVHNELEQNQIFYAGIKPLLFIGKYTIYLADGNRTNYLFFLTSYWGLFVRDQAGIERQSEA